MFLLLYNKYTRCDDTDVVLFKLYLFVLVIFTVNTDARLRQFSEAVYIKQEKLNGTTGVNSQMIQTMKTLIRCCNAENCQLTISILPSITTSQCVEVCAAIH